MTATISRLHPEGKLPELLPVRLEWLCELLAEAETLGGYRALYSRENEAGRVSYIAMQALTIDSRARYWEARIRGELTERKEKGL